MIMFNGLYNNKYIAWARAYWRPYRHMDTKNSNVPATKVVEFMSLSIPLPLFLSLARGTPNGGRMRRLKMTLIQLGAAVIYDHLATVRLIDLFLRL